MAQLNRSLTIKEGIPLCIGTIIGSGILFLPSLTYEKAGNDISVVWALLLFLCIPGVLFFSEMVQAVPDESGMGGFVSKFLHKGVGDSIPLLLLGTVGLGIPAAALVGGHYVQNYFSEVPYLKVAVGSLILVIGLVPNYFGLKLSGWVMKITAALLVCTSLVLIFLTSEAAFPNYKEIAPTFNMPQILSASVLAFWAFAGFENVTFMAGEFKNPKKDLVLSMIVAIVICGVLYFMLALNYASLIDFENIDKVAGLYQLSGYIQPTQVAASVIVAFSFFSLAINTLVWMAGISRSIYTAAKNGLLPKMFAELNRHKVPGPALLLLAGLSFFFLGISGANEDIFDKVLTVASTNFLLIYFLGILAYFRFSTNLLKKIVSGLFVLLIATLLYSSGGLLLYPLCILVIGSYLSHRQKKGAPHDHSLSTS